MRRDVATCCSFISTLADVPPPISVPSAALGPSLRQGAPEELLGENSQQVRTPALPFQKKKTMRSKALRLVIYEPSRRSFPVACVFHPVQPRALLKWHSFPRRKVESIQKVLSLSFCSFNSTHPPSLPPPAPPAAAWLWSRLAASADRPAGTWALYVQEMSSGGGRRPPSAPRPPQVLDTHLATPLSL